jgi:hypothetical protein
LPIPVWLWARKHPRSWVRNINFIVLLNGPTSIPAATGVNYASFVLVGFIFRASFLLSPLFDCQLEEAGAD